MAFGNLQRSKCTWSLQLQTKINSGGSRISQSGARNFGRGRGVPRSENELHTVMIWFLHYILTTTVSCSFQLWIKGGSIHLIAVNWQCTCCQMVKKFYYFFVNFFYSFIIIYILAVMLEIFTNIWWLFIWKINQNVSFHWLFLNILSNIKPVITQK